MDPRPPHAFTRPPPERTLIHNPNHLPPHQPQSSRSAQSQAPPFANYTPASQPQPPVHIPFTTDPYPTSRRDPFLPATAHHARNNSYGIHGGEPASSGPEERHGGWGSTAGGQGAPSQGPHAHASHHHALSGPPPPPPPSMSSSHNHNGHLQYGYEPPRRQSGGGASPPNPYGAPSHDPPPPSLSRQHMPPPSSPQQQHNAPQQRPPFSSAFGAARELPGPASAHRPGSSMSISSIIGGGDTGAPNQPFQAQSSPSSGPTNGPASGHHSSMQPPSPRRALPPGSRPDVQGFRRHPSPDRHMYGNSASRPSEGQGYAVGSPTRSYNTHGSPEQGRPPLHQMPQPYKPMVFQGARPHASPANDLLARGPRQSPVGIPPRPSSQPPGPPGHPDYETRTVHEAFGGRRAAYGPQEERRRTMGEAQHSRPNVAEILGAAPQPSVDRDRPVTVQPVSHSPFSPPGEARSLSGPAQPPRSVWRHSAPEDAHRESTGGRREEPPALYRGYGGYPSTAQAPPPYSHHVAEDMVRGRSLDHLNNRVIEQYHAPPTSDPLTGERYKAEQLTRSLSSGGSAYPGRPLYDQSRRMGEEIHNKALFALGEANRRTGRASPLPQAVQGAQAQPVSIGKDPGIKSEFGRMFSGLGSGLGSSTPSRQSPMPQGGPEILPPGVDFNDLRLQRVNSQPGRKSKRVKDEDGLLDNESADGRGTPSARGSKRNKHAHPGHHHHHHVHPHHHHHHHHKPEDDIPPHLVPVTTASYSGRYANPPQNGASSHHHHHYHGAPHHHHHAPRASQPIQLPPLNLPSKVHDIHPILEKASVHTRFHLGSYLYEATPELPRPNSHLDDQFSYASIPKPLPLFDRNPINCIVTCRVPRYYLRPRQRQQIVLQRHLWGAQIYRDDSDPLAAAIHSGWIRGEWDDTVDVNMLDPRITAPNDPSDAEVCLSKPPTAPVTPPADMDLQIDLLVLPRLEKYVGTVEYGISSRKSVTHDGLSFKIHQIRWVDEGFGSRGQERTAAAMKRRLDASTALLSLTNGGEDVLRAVNGTAKLHA